MVGKEQLSPLAAAKFAVPLHVSCAQRLLRNACPGFYGLHYDASLIAAFLLAINYFNIYSWISVNSFYSTPINTLIPHLLPFLSILLVHNRHEQAMSRNYIKLLPLICCCKSFSYVWFKMTNFCCRA